MEKAATKSTLMEPNALKVLVKNTGQATPKDIRLYQSIIGSLMYAMTQTRLDLAFPVSLLSRFATNPSAAHMGAAKRVLKYLKHTRDLGITYKGHTKTSSDDFHAGSGDFHGYLDVDWARDIETRTSTSAYIFFLFGAPIT